MSLLTIKYKRPFVYDYQRAILDNPARFTVCEASTKVGKTASHIIWLFEQALILGKTKNPVGKKVWWVAPVYGQAEIAYNRMKRQVKDKLGNSFFRTNETKLVLTTPAGVEIHFKSAEKPDNLYGDDVYAAVFDEFTRARETAWHALRSTLTATKGKCKFIGNVKGKKNWGYKLALRAKQGENDWAYFKITAWDAVAAGCLDRQEVEDAKAILPEGVFKELYEADASDDGSNPFGIKFISACTWPLSTLPAHVHGIDLAKKRDWFVSTSLDKLGGVCAYERFQKPWQEVKNTILALPNKPMAIDATGAGDPIVEDIQRARSNVEGFIFSSPSKQMLMEGLAYAIQNKLISFPEFYVDELEAFEYEATRTGVKYSAPEGVHDDKVCSLALAWYKYQQFRGQGNYSIGSV
jgi:hypothetical protein